ncbi:MAG: hypothetical protein JSR55_04035 [Proteobacteria bacterium]|nr:hypothetical protein [Pseudomonadota bacterium]
MNTLKKSLKLAGALAIALGAASPLMATSASAAPYGGHAWYGDRDNGRDHGRYDWQRDHRRMPKILYERRPAMPHHGHYRWRDGRWNWHRDHWVWAPGIWIRF